MKRGLTFVVGMLMGAALVCGANATTGVLAQPAWSPIYVDGQQVQMTAYNILGNNYVKLRDIGQAVGFNVYYQNGVQVDSKTPYTGEAPAKTPAASSISVASYKGNTLNIGDRSGLMISPNGTDYAVTSSAPVVIAVEKVSSSWVAVAKSAGSATITVTNSTGETGRLTLTVESAVPVSSDTEIDLKANMDIRLEMVRLINQVRRENGVAELPVNEALMNAAQDCSAQGFRTHNNQYESEAALNYGWLYGGGNNLTWFNQVIPGKIAERAIANWVNSPGHFQTLIRTEATCLGVGVTVNNDIAYCYMFVGDPNGHGIL